MIFHVYKFATSSDVQINSIKKNGKVHRRRAFLFFVFLRTMFVRHQWFLREAKIDTQGTTFRSPTLFFILPLQFTSNYRTLPMRIEPVGVFIIERLIPDNRARLSFFLYPLFYREYCTFLLGKEREEADDNILLSLTVRRTSRFSIWEKNLPLFTFRAAYPFDCLLPRPSQNKSVSSSRFSCVILKAARKTWRAFLWCPRAASDWSLWRMTRRTAGITMRKRATQGV